MKRDAFVGLLTAGSLSTAGPVLAAVPNAAPLPSSGDEAPQFARADALITSFMRQYEVPAASVAIAKDGRLVHARAFGYRDPAKTRPVTPSDRFRIASNSKPITAVAVMLLVERGRLTLDDRAFDLLSDLTPPAGAHVDPRLRTITIRNLLDHSGGFDSTRTDPQFDALRVASAALGRPSPATNVDIIRYMMGQPLAFDPGSKFLYSNLGYNILGRVIEKVTGTAYEAFCRSDVLAPAGISRMKLGRTKAADRLADEVQCWDDPIAPNSYSVYVDDLPPVPTSYGGFAMEAIDAHGGWLASAVDLTRFLNAVGGQHGKQVLHPETVRTMWARPGLAQYRNGGKYYALGWDIVPAKVIAGHNGAITWGTLSSVQRLPGNITTGVNFNRLPFDIVKAIVALENQITEVFSAISGWPEVDLYPKYS